MRRVKENKEEDAGVSDLRLNWREGIRLGG